MRIRALKNFAGTDISMFEGQEFDIEIETQRAKNLEGIGYIKILEMNADTENKETKKRKKKAVEDET